MNRRPLSRRRPRRWFLARPTVALAAACWVATLLSCQRGQTPSVAVQQSYSFTQGPTVGDLSLAPVPGGLLVVYTDPATLSLVLVETRIGQPADGECAARPGPRTHFERVADSLEAGALFGNHVLLSRPGRVDLFYHDLQARGAGLTKWVHKSSADQTWWVDVLPFDGLLLAALPGGEGEPRLVYQERGAMLMSDLEKGTQPVRLLESFDAASRGQAVDSDPSGSFTVYDRISRRLYLVDNAGPAPVVLPIHASGQVHYARLVDGRRSFLLYDPSSATLLTLDEQAGSYSANRLTLSQQTSTVFFTDLAGARFYLFDEYDPDAPEDLRYRLALLRREPRTGLRFSKTVLAAAPRPLRACRVAQAGDCLAILCVREALSLITVSLSAPPVQEPKGPASSE